MTTQTAILRRCYAKPAAAARLPSEKFSSLFMTLAKEPRSGGEALCGTALVVHPG